MEAIDLSFCTNQKLPKYHQFTNLLLNKISNGELKIGQRLPSIIEASAVYCISRDTVLRAYKDLSKKGFLTSVYRKGYFVSLPSTGTPGKKVLILTSGLNSANFLFYQNLSKQMEEKNLQCDLKVYYNDFDRLNYFIDEALGNYHTFIVDRQQLNSEKVLSLFKTKVAKDEIILLNDDNTGEISCKRHIFMDIEEDFNCSLQNLTERLDRYNTLNLILPSKEYFPYKLINGFFNYCDGKQVDGQILEEITTIEKGNAYIIIDESSLFDILSRVCPSAGEIGKNIGLLTLFERPYMNYLSKRITSLDWFNKKLMKKVMEAIKGDNDGCMRASVKINLRDSL